MERIFLGLGSNIGDREGYLRKALTGIQRIQGTKIKKCSMLYETEPWGDKQQGIYLNCVIEIETKFEPDDLLNHLKRIEQEAGREPREKWAEREIDIDILLYGDRISEALSIKIPHPEIQNRKFVLIPLNEIASDLIHPYFKKSVLQLLLETEDKSEVKIYHK